MDSVPQDCRKVGLGGREEERDGLREAETEEWWRGDALPPLSWHPCVVCEGKRLFLKPNLPHLPKKKKSQLEDTVSGLLVLKWKEKNYFQIFILECLQTWDLSRKLLWATVGLAHTVFINECLHLQREIFTSIWPLDILAWVTSAFSRV